MNKKQLFIWSLYDFANSIVAINFILYFSVWIVVDGGLSDFWYNAIFAIASLILLFSAPNLAARIDLRGGGKRWLNIATVGTFIFYSLAAIFAGADFHVLLIALMFLIGQYFYQLSFVFYNPMLDDIADDAHKSRVSGIGNFASSLGFVIGILITLPFADSRITPLLISIPVFFVLALPMMIFFKEAQKNNTEVAPDQARDNQAFVRKMLKFLAVSTATPMLLAFFFYNDAFLTVSNNYSIYLERVFKVSDTTKSVLLLLVLITSAIGSVIAGWLGDKIGPFRTLKYILLGWVITLPLLALVSNFFLVSAVSVLMGLLIGSAWTTSRAYLITVLPKKDMSYGFSFYTIAERFSTLVGPMTWGIIISVMGTEAFAYRVAVMSMMVFVIIGFFILHSWKRKKDYGV